MAVLCSCHVILLGENLSWQGVFAIYIYIYIVIARQNTNRWFSMTFKIFKVKISPLHHFRLIWIDETFQEFYYTRGLFQTRKNICNGFAYFGKSILGPRRQSLFPDRTFKNSAILGSRPLKVSGWFNEATFHRGNSLLEGLPEILQRFFRGSFHGAKREKGGRKKRKKKEREKKKRRIFLRKAARPGGGLDFRLLKDASTHVNETTFIIVFLASSFSRPTF